jgi:hypothetical protein
MSTQSKMRKLIEYSEQSVQTRPESKLNPKALATPQGSAKSNLKKKPKLMKSRLKRAGLSSTYSAGDEDAKPGDALRGARFGGGWSPR